MSSVQATALQFPVTMDVAENLAKLVAGVCGLDTGGIVVAPEGVLSGYLPMPGFVTSLDIGAIERAIDNARNLALNRQVHLIFGACVCTHSVWRNATFYFGPQGQLWRYDKINLAQSERGTFTPGDRLPVLEINCDGEPLHLGVQMCREIRYPEQWRMLATQGAQVIAYVNNAIGSKHGREVWRSHMISRAAETQRFVIGANNAATDQTCPSMIISPSRAVLSELAIGAEGAARATLSLDEVSNQVVSQARNDVVTVSLRD